jgi:hypothetical protein
MRRLKFSNGQPSCEAVEVNPISLFRFKKLHESFGATRGDAALRFCSRRA